MARRKPASKAQMIAATLDLLRAAGLAGAGINNIVAASGSLKGSVYHFFPGGKHELVAAALRQAEGVVGEGFRTIFSGDAAPSQKVQNLFKITAERFEATGFTTGCPAAAVTLDIDDASEDLRAITDAVFTTWQQIITSGLHNIPAAERIARLILATLEGALILSRAQASADPLAETGGLLAMTLRRAFFKIAEQSERPKATEHSAQPGTRTVMTKAGDPEIPAGFDTLFRTSPFLDTVGPFFYRRDPPGLVIGLRVANKIRRHPRPRRRRVCGVFRFRGEQCCGIPFRLLASCYDRSRRMMATRSSTPTHRTKR
jgi:TetR/AcrR family transcriptional repressor of lmrAB and yxaGH operons